MTALKKSPIVVKLIAFLALFLFSSVLYMQGQNKKNVIVFIHGTLFPGLALLNPYETYTQTLQPDDLYIKTLTRLRNDHTTFHDSIILEPGLQKISPSVISLYNRELLTPAQSKLGAYQAVGVYHDLSTLCHREPCHNDYYTFGFLGALSDNHRKETSQALYQELIMLKKQYQKEGYDPDFTLIAFSHGGNTALYLAHVEDQEKQELAIENTFLLATPIQKETALFATHSMFKNIINIYSEGDTIQTNEIISTHSSESYHALGDLIDTKAINAQSGKNILDLRLLAEDNAQAFGHCAFWYFDRYASSLNWLDAKTQKIFDTLSPLPLVVLIPVLQATYAPTNKQQQKKSLLDAIITLNVDKCTLKIIDPVTKYLMAESVNIIKPLQKAQSYLVRTWVPYAQCGDSFKAVLGLLTALKVAMAY